MLFQLFNFLRDLFPEQCGSPAPYNLIMRTHGATSERDWTDSFPELSGVEERLPVVKGKGINDSLFFSPLDDVVGDQLGKERVHAPDLHREHARPALQLVLFLDLALLRLREAGQGQRGGSVHDLLGFLVFINVLRFPLRISFFHKDLFFVINEFKLAAQEFIW